MNNNASGSIPLILFLFGVIAFGGLYTLMFIVIMPHLWPLIADSAYKTVIVYGVIWFAPLVVIFVGILALVTEGMKRHPSWRYTE